MLFYFVFVLVLW